MNGLFWSISQLPQFSNYPQSQIWFVPYPINLKATSSLFVSETIFMLSTDCLGMTSKKNTTFGQKTTIFFRSIQNPKKRVKAHAQTLFNFCGLPISGSYQG